MIRNGLYNLIGGVVRVFSITFTTPLLIRFMGLENYGLWALVSSVVGLVTLAEAGLSTGMIVTVQRRMPLYDTYLNRSAGDL